MRSRFVLSAVALLCGAIASPSGAQGRVTKSEPVTKAPPPPPIQVTCPAVYTGRFWVDEVPAPSGAGAPAPARWTKGHIGPLLFVDPTFKSVEISTSTTGRPPTEVVRVDCAYRFSWWNDQMVMTPLHYLETRISRDISPACRKANPALWKNAGAVPVSQQNPNGPKFEILKCSTGVNECIVLCDRT